MGRFSRLKVLFGSKTNKKSGQAITTATTWSTPLLSPQATLVPLSSQHIEPPSVGNAVGDDLWAEAFRKFETREPELAADYTKHLNAFHKGQDGSIPNLANAGSVGDLIQHLLADREKKQWRVPLLEKDVKIRAQVEKLTKFCLYTDEIVKQAFSSQPHAAIAWSGVSILLPLITSGKVQHDAMLAGFEYIGGIQMYWRIYEENNRNHNDPRQKEIHEALAKLYSYIVEYQARVICHLSSAQLSRTWQKVADLNDWDGKKQGITELDAHCRRLVSESEKASIQRQRDLQLQEIQESRTILAEIRKGLQGLENQAVSRHNDAKETALLHDLSSDYEHYKNVNPLRVQGTCEWLFKDAGFRKWRASTESSLLWVSAGPGCGKSVLTRCLIDENRLSNNATTSIVCYFFFQTGVEGQMDSANAVTGILHQLFVQDSTGELIKKGLESHRNHGDKLRNNFAELWRILIASAKSYPSGEIICVLDALDECGEESREKFLMSLDSFFTIEAYRCRLKFLITSRPYDDLEVAFKKHTNRSNYIHVDGDEKAMEIGQEINLVIDIKVEEFTEDFSKNHRTALSERLKAMENRTYLWLYLTFDIIKKRRAFFSKASRIQDLLNSIPNRVSEAYETILNHTSDDPADQLMTKGLLELILAATRPLSLDEANYALTLQVANSQFPSHLLIMDELWPEESFKSVVKNLSGLFITVCDSRLSFIHLTAREFLTDTKKQGEWHGKFPMNKAHNTMASVCIHYLSAVDPGILGDGVESLRKGFPFLPYSIANWSFHYNSQNESDRLNLLERARKLCDTSQGRGDQLMGMYSQTMTAAWTIDYGSVSELNMACALGLNTVVSAIVDELDLSSDDMIEVYGMALCEAAYEGYPDVTQTLLKKAGKSEGYSQMNNMALGYAVTRIGGDEKRQIAVLRVLFESLDGLHILTPDVPLHAMHMGSRALVSLLLEKLGNEINLTEEVLMMAASNFSHGPEVMQLLLDEKSEQVHITAGVVEAAAGNYKFGKEIMALLLDRRGSEVDITYDVLDAAVRTHTYDVLALLLAIRGDTIQLSEKLLEAALGNHHCGLEMMQFLFQQRGDEIIITEKLVNVAVCNRKYGDQLLKLLLEKGGDDITLTSKTLEAAAANPGCGVQLVQVLLDLKGCCIPITDMAMEKAADNDMQAEEITALLLKRQDEDSKIVGGLPK